MLLNHYSPLQDIAPQIVEALPKFVPTEQIGIHESRLQAHASRLGFTAISIGGYEGHVVDYEETPFNAAFGPRFEDGIEMGKGRSDPQVHDTLHLELNIPQISALALRTDRIRDPTPWISAINTGLKSALVDHGLHRIPDSLSYRDNAALQFRLIPTRLAANIKK